MEQIVSLRIKMSENQCYIYAVRYGRDGRRIQQVKARVLAKTHSKPEQILSRERIIELIDSGFIVETRIKITREDYRPGVAVLAYTLGKERFIKTEANSIEADNLGELDIF